MMSGAALALVLGGAGCARRSSAAGQAAAEAPTPVQVAPARVQPRERVWVAHGQGVPPQVVPVAFEIEGRLAARMVERGARVAAGAALAALEAAPYQHALAGAQAAARRQRVARAQAARDARRARALEAQGALEEAAREAAEAGRAALDAGLAGARAELAEARRRLARAVLRAPAAGRVAAVLAEPGEVIAAGRPVLLLHREGPAEVEVALADDFARAVALGDVLEVWPAVGPALAGVVVELGVAGPGRLTPARLRLPAEAPGGSGGAGSGGVRPGEAVAVRLRRVAGEALFVPLASVVDPSGRGPFVLRVDGARVARAPVRLGALQGAWVEVRAGLEAGALVVTSHRMGLRPGQRVQVVGQGAGAEGAGAEGAGAEGAGAEGAGARP